jgi:siroheme synthase (precorrin-2 oxidase/ferrochelatase)
MTEPATLDVTKYPFIFFPVGLNLRDRKCVVIGAEDDREATEKVEALREVGADVTWIRDYNDLRDEDVADAFFVIFTPQEEPPAIRMRALADKYKFLLCAIDQPKHGFVAMQATVKAGPCRIAISTGGIAPRVGGKLRAALQATRDDQCGTPRGDDREIRGTRDRREDHVSEVVRGRARRYASECGA